MCPKRLDTPERNYILLEEAVELSGLPRKVVRDMCKHGMPHIRLSNKTLIFDRQWFLNWINDQFKTLDKPEEK